MTELQMREDSRYYRAGDHKPFNGSGIQDKVGTRISESEFKDGRREGEHVVFWPESGEQRSVTTYSQGMRHGLASTWSEDGVLLSEIGYKLGKKDGVYRTWFPSGSPNEEGAHASGLKDGPWVKYFDAPTAEQKKRTEEATYAKGKLSGKKRIWNDNGLLGFQGEFSNNQMVGQHTTWNESGAKVESATYSLKGGLSEVTRWDGNGEVTYRGVFREGVLLEEEVAEVVEVEEEVPANQTEISELETMDPEEEEFDPIFDPTFESE